MLSFKSAFSLSPFMYIKRFFSSSSISAIRGTSAYLRLLILVSAVLIPTCDSSSQAFHVMYCAYKLNKHSDNIQPWCTTPFPIWHWSVVPCLILTVASWHTYRFLKRQLRWFGTPIFWRIFHSLLPYTVKGFSRVSKTGLEFFWNSLAFSVIQQMLAIWFLVPLPFVNPTCTSGSSQFTHYWSLAWRILSITLLAYEMNTTVQ